MRNTLYTNDNLYILSGLNSDLVDLIYLDPPFSSERTYSAPVGSTAAGASFKNFVATDQLPKRTDLKEIPMSASVKQQLFKQQTGKCNACGQEFDSRNLEIDHIVPKSKGGGDFYENYQLLCGSCNRIKGDRPMEYLRMKIEARERLVKSQVFFGE